jgi:hypothetical protein
VNVWIACVLDVHRGKDYIVSSQDRLHLDIPVEADDETFYVIEFYIADLYGTAGRTSVELNRNLQWLTSEEVLSGHASDCIPVNPMLVELLNKAAVIAQDTNCS